MARVPVAGWLAVTVVLLIVTGPVGESSPRLSESRMQVDEAERALLAPGASGVPGPDVALATPNRGEVLENETRAAIHGAVLALPGIHVARAAVRTDVSQSTARYHVRVLERADLVDSEKLWGKRRLFPASLFADQRPVAAAVTDPTLGPVLEAVAATQPATVTALAAELDRAPSTVSHHLATLANDGLVERERDGESVVSRLSAAVASVDL